MWNLGGGIGAVEMGAIDYSTDPPTIDFQKAWYTMNVNLKTFLKGLPEEQTIRIRGEDLLASPETYLRQIAEWLGLRIDDQAIEAMKHPERSPYACFGPPNARLGNDPSFLREPELRRSSHPREYSLNGPLPWREDGEEFSLEVRELAEEFGYT